MTNLIIIYVFLGVLIICSILLGLMNSELYTKNQKLKAKIICLESRNTMLENYNESSNKEILSLIKEKQNCEVALKVCEVKLHDE